MHMSYIFLALTHGNEFHWIDKGESILEYLAMAPPVALITNMD